MSPRRPRSLPAGLAVLASLLLLAVPRGAAHAAVADAEFDRLSGPTRYSTAVQIAESYIEHVDELPDAPRVDTVIMASGLDEHAGWSAPVPMLSRLHRAPLLFTRPDEVPVPVEQFLQRGAIRRVILLGGTQVITADVERELRALGVEVIERLGSDDVYLHAVAVAESFDHPAGQLPRRGRTVLLASGTVFADALAAGPMAYQGEFPILLTPPDRLHPAVSDYLIASNVEHIRILGGPKAVGLSVLQTLSGLDFTSDRIQGRDRYGTAVKLAEAQLGGTGLRPCFDGAELGLAFGGLSPDALASGPLLGELCAPLLLTPADTLPRTVASFLRSDRWVTGDAANELDVTVFGGPAVVPPEVVTQFAERATTLVPIGGRISVELEPRTAPDMPPTTREFAVFFDSDIAADRIAEAVEGGMFRVNHERVFPTPSGRCVFAGNGIREDLLYGCVHVSRSAVTLTLSRDLTAEDLITVADGHRIGTNDSPRPTARLSYVIPEPEEPADRDAPDIDIIAPAGHNQIALLVIDANPYNAPGTADDLSARVAVAAADGSTKALDGAVSQVGRRSGTRAPHDRYVLTLAGGGTLEVGDAITVPRGVFLDEDGRSNPLRRFVVRDHGADFRIESVTIGDVETANQARVVLSATTQLNAAPTGSLTITARPDGIASGGRGNDWRVYGVGLPETEDEPDAEAVDCSEPDAQCITVSLNRAGRVIEYRIHAGEPTFADLAEALAAHPDFAANFTVEADGVQAGSGTIGGTVVAGRQLGGGGTAMGVRVRFSQPVAALLDASDARNPLAADNVDCANIPLVADLAPRLIPAGDGCTLQFDAPDQIMHMTLTTVNVTRLPELGELVFVNGNAATDYAQRRNIVQGWLSIRYDADVPAD